MAKVVSVNISEKKGTLKKPVPEIELKLRHGIDQRIVCDMNIPIHCCFAAGVTQQFLQHLRLHTAFDCSCSIGMSQGVHTKVFDPCFIAELI